jgi:hypothetical protein
MKKLLTIAAVTLLTASLSLAQAAAGPGDTKQNSGKKADNLKKVKTAPQKGGPGDKVSLNPQPLPPGARVSLNPQPLPPGVVKNGTKGSPENKVAINPQPLPPKQQNSAKKAPHGSRVELNPQPEPPGVTESKKKPAGKPSTSTQKSQTEKNAPAPK